MKLVLFTSRSSLPGTFANNGRNNGRYELVVKGPDAIGQRDDTIFDFCYLDISGLDEGLCKRLIKKIRTAYPLRPWGILDLDGESGDPAWFFHEGAADYLGPGCAAEGFTSYISDRNMRGNLKPRWGKNAFKSFRIGFCNTLTICLLRWMPSSGCSPMLLFSSSYPLKRPGPERYLKPVCGLN